MPRGGLSGAYVSLATIRESRTLVGASRKTTLSNRSEISKPNQIRYQKLQTIRVEKAFHMLTVLFLRDIAVHGMLGKLATTKTHQPQNEADRQSPANVVVPAPAAPTMLILFPISDWKPISQIEQTLGSIYSRFITQPAI